MGDDDDIRRRARAIRAEADEATAAAAMENERLERSNQERVERGLKIEQLCSQFFDWASRNRIPTSWRSGFKRGWILAENTTYSGTDGRNASTVWLVVTSTGRIVKSSEGIRSGSRTAWDLSVDDLGGWNIEDVKGHVSRLVADSGREW